METPYLIFRVQNNFYGLPIDKVSEVVQYQELTPIPFAPNYLRGIFNLRKEALAVVDLSVILFNQMTNISKTTSIMVSHLQNHGESLQVGLLVDQVLEVLPIKSQAIQSVKEIKENLKQDFFIGVFENQGKFIVLLNLNKILDFAELKKMADLGKETFFAETIRKTTDSKEQGV